MLQKLCFTIYKYFMPVARSLVISFSGWWFCPTGYPQLTFSSPFDERFLAIYSLLFCCV